MASLIQAVVAGLGQVGLSYDIKEGKIQSQTLTHCKALQDSEFFELDTVVDINENSRLLAERLYGAQSYENILDLSRVTSCELLVWALPTNQHSSILRVLDLGIRPKFILLEKPLGDDFHEAQKIVNAINELGIPFAVNYFRRFLPTYLKCKEVLAGLDSPKIVSVHITGYGSISNIFSHFINLLYFLLPDTKFELKLGHDVARENAQITVHCKDFPLRLSGLGEGAKPCKLKVDLNNNSLVVDEKNRVWELFDLNGNLVDSSTNHFPKNLIDDQFENPQKFVYLELGQNFGKDLWAQGNEDALYVQEFVTALNKMVSIDS